MTGMHRRHFLAGLDAARTHFRGPVVVGKDRLEI